MEHFNSANVPGETPFPSPSSAQVDESIYLQVWNMIHAREAKSTDAIKGSSTDLQTALPGLEPRREGEGNTRGQSASTAHSLPKKCFSGINCVLGDEDQVEKLVIPPSRRFDVVQRHSDIVGEAANYSPIGPESQFYPGGSPFYVPSDQLAQGFPRFHSYFPPQSVVPCELKTVQETLPSCQMQDIYSGKPQTQSFVPATVQESKQRSSNVTNSTAGDLNSNFLTEDNQNNQVNRNNININLTFAMGQYLNGGRSDPPPFFDAQAMKPPRIRTSVKKPKAEIAIQTDSDSLSDLTAGSSHTEHVQLPAIGYDVDSTSEFPSTIPSRHNCQRQKSSENAVCIPETKLLSLDEYLDFPAMVAYTGESMKSIIQTADHILNNYILLPDDNYYTEEELVEGEGKLGISVMRLLGVPQQLRHSIYNEALHTIQAIKEISTETVSVINHVIDWLCEGDGDGGKKIVNRLRRLASVTTDIQPDSETWYQFEDEFCAFTETVGEVMKQGYAVARHCSKTVLASLTQPNSLALTELNTTGGAAEASSLSSPVSTTTAGTSSLTGNAASSSAGVNDVGQVQEEDLASISLGSVVDAANRVELTRDAFMEAPLPESENPITSVFNSACRALAMNLLNKTQGVFKGLQGTGATPILGESQCSSRDEVDMRNPSDLTALVEDLNGNPRDLEYLTTEIQKLAALTDSYFIEPQNSNEVISEEPKQECPPPPVPARMGGNSRQKEPEFKEDSPQQPHVLNESCSLPKFREGEETCPVKPVEDQNANCLLPPIPALKEEFPWPPVPVQKEECAPSQLPKRAMSKIARKQPGNGSRKMSHGPPPKPRWRW